MARPRINVAGVSKGAQDRLNGESKTPHLDLPDGISMWKLPTKTNAKVTIDILPYPVTNKHHPDSVKIQEGYWYRSAFYVHTNVGPNNEFVICPTTFGKPCPICEHFNVLNNTDGLDWTDDIKPFQKKPRSLFAVSVLDQKDLNPDDIFLWDVSDHVFHNYLDNELAVDEQRAMFASPDADGLSIQIRVKEKVFGKSSFGEPSRIDFIARDEAIPDEMLDDVPELDDLFVVKDYDYLASLIGADVDEPELEERPSRRSRRTVEVDEEEEPPVTNRGSRRRVTADPVEEEEDEQPPTTRRGRRQVAEEEEEDERPSRRGSRRHSEPEEEEEEPPSRRSRGEGSRRRR